MLLIINLPINYIYEFDLYSPLENGKLYTGQHSLDN